MKSFLLLLGICMPAFLFSQIWYSNGAVATVTSGGVMFVNGGSTFAAGSSFSNEGVVTVTRNSTLPSPGNLRIESGATVQGSGTYAVEQDWINNGSFSANASTVALFGNLQQFITSDNAVSTTFNNLTLTGTGTGNNRKKTLTLNAGTSATGILNLNDRELETQGNSFYVYNPTVAAVLYNTVFGSEGFVSSTGSGYLGRTTSAAGAYVFPTGSSQGTLRFRPLTITLASATVGEFGARLNNYNADNDNYLRTQTDGTFCNLNDLFYHSAECLSGSSTADISIAYLPAADGSWNEIAHWETGTSLWYNTGTNNPSTAGSYSIVTKPSWNFGVQGNPFVLSNSKANAPTLNCPQVCENSDGNVFTVAGSGTSYQWTFPSNSILTSGQGTSSAEVSWGVGSGTVSVVSVDASGCSSLPATCDPIVLPGPDVHFSYVASDGDFSFTDNTGGTTMWNWDFGDGSSSTTQNPSHTYAPGSQFTVTLIAENANGCFGSETQLVEYFKEVVIPNVITPNNDGANDVFLINVPPVDNYSITIVNRWGSVVYQSSDPTKSWDGKLDGTNVTDGVYFYVLKFSTSTQDYSFEGNVSVFQH